MNDESWKRVLDASVSLGAVKFGRAQYERSDVRTDGSGEQWFEVRVQGYEFRMWAASEGHLAIVVRTKCPDGPDLTAEEMAWVNIAVSDRCPPSDDYRVDQCSCGAIPWGSVRPVPTMTTVVTR